SNGVVVSGTVGDQTGAVLPSARIELRNAAGEAVQSTTSGADGQFTFTSVPPGRYDLVSTFQGFQDTTVRVTVGTRAPSPVRVTMPIAGINQEATVGNPAAAVRADAISNIDSSTIDQQALENLPIFNDD